MNSLGTTAILVFANSAKEELENKAFPNGEQLFDALTQTTLQKAKRTGLPVFHFTENEQIGSDFGERFTNSIALVFKQGYENVITIGNDTPHLKTQHLKKAAYQLALGKTVLGPSADGGFYLMGLQKLNFDADTFKNLPWQRFSLFNQISLWLKRESLEISRLPVLQDIDSEKDIKSILVFSRSLAGYIFKLIMCLLGHKSGLSYKRHIFIDLFLQRSLYNKGSPQVLLV